MTGIVEQRGKFRFATKLLPNCFLGVRYVIELIGGPDRDRTDDLFHAMEARSQLRHRPTLPKGRLTSFSTSKIDSSNADKSFPESLLLSFRLALAALVSTVLVTSPSLAHAAAAQAAVNPAQPRTQVSLALGNALQQV